MSGSRNGYTQTELRILDVLRDGEPHTKQEILDCLVDPMADWSAACAHVGRLRRKLLPRGETVLAQVLNRRIYYRQVRLISESEE